jgi:hypothetical protein
MRNTTVFIVNLRLRAAYDGDLPQGRETPRYRRLDSHTEDAEPVAAPCRRPECFDRLQNRDGYQIMSKYTSLPAKLKIDASIRI